MKALVATALLVLAAGCGTLKKSSTQPNGDRPPGCHGFECGGNGTRTHGTVDDRAPRVESR